MAFWGSCFCSNKLSGTVEINGEKVGFNSCRNGAVHGFRGVELSGSNGMKLRLGLTPTGHMGVIVFDKGATTGKELTATCGSLSISDQNSTVNNVKNIQGKASLDCDTDGYKIKGDVSFENCH
jgi:hypothetical protein